MMQEAVLDNLANFERLLAACNAGGHSRVGALSNIGLPRGRVRVTILPNGAFLAGQPSTSNFQWLKLFREILAA